MLICSSIRFIEHKSAFVWLQKRTLNYCTYFAITNIILWTCTAQVIDIMCKIFILCSIDLLRYHTTSCIRRVTRVLNFQKIWIKKIQIYKGKKSDGY